MKQAQYLLEIATLFSDSTSLQKEVILAIEKPKEYITTHQNNLAERGITAPIENLPWLALVNGLIAKQLAHELDWKDDPEETITVVLETTKHYKNYPEIRQTLSTIEPLLNDDIEEFLPALNRRLKPHEIQLVWLDIDSDSYPLAILAVTHVEQAKLLATKAGYGRIR